MPDQVTENALALELLLRERELLERLLVVAMLSSSPLCCDSCGWPTQHDRRQLELEGVHDVGGTDCARCTARLRARY